MSHFQFSCNGLGWVGITWTVNTFLGHIDLNLRFCTAIDLWNKSK